MALEPISTDDLPCGDDKAKQLEFVGPVQIYVSDKPDQLYHRVRWMSAFVSLCYLIWGLVYCTTFMYSCSHDSSLKYYLHASVYTAVFQVLVPFGILIHNPLNSVFQFQKATYRATEHAIVMTMAVFFSWFGTNNVPSLQLQTSSHHYWGTFGVVFLSFTLFLGPAMAWKFWEEPQGILKASRFFHRVFGLTAAICGCVSFILGMTQESFLNWLPPGADGYAYFLIFLWLTTFAFIVWKPIKHLVRKIQAFIAREDWSEMHLECEPHGPKDGKVYVKKPDVTPECEHPFIAQGGRKSYCHR